MTAMRMAVHDITAMLAGTDRPHPLWLFSDGPPGPRMDLVNRTAPGAALRIEASVTAAIREHGPPGGGLSDQAFATMTIPATPVRTSRDAPRG